MTTTAERLRRAAVEVDTTESIPDDWREPLASWLRSAAEDAEQIGADPAAVKFADQVLR